MRILTVPVFLILSTACSDIESADLLTSGMYANISVTAQGDGNSRADAILRAGEATSNVFVELSPDDALTVKAGDSEPVAMQGYELGAYHGYEATLPTDDPGTTFTVALTRTLDEGAPTSTVTLPAPFEVDAVEGSFSRADDLTLTWGPIAENEPMTITAIGECTSLFTTTVAADTGTITIPGGTFVAVEGSEGANCAIDFDFQRSKTGTVDPGYGNGGVAVGIQKRAATSNSTP